MATSQFARRIVRSAAADRGKPKSNPLKKNNVPLPTRQQILDFVRDSPTPVGKREIARAFQITGADRIPLKAMLKELEQDGQIDRGRDRKSTRLNSSHQIISYAVFCLKKKKGTVQTRMV